MVSGYDEPQLPKNPESEPPVDDIWEGLSPDDQRRSVQLLAQLIYKAVVVSDEKTSPEEPD